MFKSYTVLVNAFVYTASRKCIPVVGRGNVGGIPNYLRVPTLETNLLSVPHMDVTMKWSTTFDSGVCLDDDRRSEAVKFTGVLDCDIMLYVVSAEHLLGSNISADACNVFKNSGSNIEG